MGSFERGKRDIGNNVEPDPTPQYAASDLGLHCLLISGFTLFALNTGYVINHTINKTNNQTPLLLEKDQYKEMRRKSPFGINGLRGKICTSWIVRHFWQTRFMLSWRLSLNAAFHPFPIPRLHWPLPPPHPQKGFYMKYTFFIQDYNLSQLEQSVFCCIALAGRFIIKLFFF